MYPLHLRRLQPHAPLALLAALLAGALALPGTAAADDRGRGPGHWEPRRHHDGDSDSDRRHRGRFSDRRWDGRGHDRRGGHPPGRHRGWHKPGHPHQRHAPRGRFSFAIPNRLGPRDYGRYHDYYRGPVWYPAHRHSHRVYLFPVSIAGGVRYVEHHYCGASLYRRPDRRHGGWRGFFGLRFNF